MRSKALQEQYEKAKVIDGKLRADDPRFNGVVRIVHEDGSILFWECAFAEKHAGGPEGNLVFSWWFVFTEHHGFHVYADDEVQVRQYK